MVLTTTDIGTKAEDVEENLTRNFKIAKSWNAVLLIDEADVFVANRTIKDLYRSSLVASMLTHLSEVDINEVARKIGKISLTNPA
jgi:hypothetical protein